MKKPLQTVLLLFFAGTFVFSVWKLLSIHGSYQEGQNGYADLEQYVSFQRKQYRRKHPQRMFRKVPGRRICPPGPWWILVNCPRSIRILLDGSSLKEPISITRLYRGPIMTTICSICSMALITVPGASFWMLGAHLISRTDTASSTAIT